MVKDSNDAMLYHDVLFIPPCGDSVPKVFIYYFYEFKECMLGQIHSRMCVYSFLNEFYRFIQLYSIYNLEIF
jgi:hypothetical protein